MNNQFLQLKQQRLQRATKPFMARGNKVQRCSQCMLAQSLCICRWRKNAELDAGFCLLMHGQEILKPTNTGKLIADVFTQQTYAFEWHRTESDPRLLELLSKPKWQPILVFPEEYVEPSMLLCEEQPSNEQNGDEHHSIERTDARPLFVILDGTWAQCKKMYRCSDYLRRLPVLSLRPELESDFKLRKAPEASHLCTVEVAVEVLKWFKADVQSAHLYHYYQIFNRHYYASRRSQTVDIGSPDHQYINNLT